MPYRALPDSDTTRSTAINAAVAKNAAVDAPDRLISAATATALASLATRWTQETGERAAALGRQTSSTSVLDGIGARLRLTAMNLIELFIV